VRQPAPAQTVEQFYSGRQITLIIGNAVGSGYDAIGAWLPVIWASTCRRPHFIAQNMNGAGGIHRSQSHEFDRRKDGSVICVTNREAIFDPLFPVTARGEITRPRKFLWDRHAQSGRSAWPMP